MSVPRVLSCLFRQPTLEPTLTDLSSQTIVLTGPTIGGIGHETAKKLAQFNARLILAARNITTAQTAAESIRSVASKAVDVLQCDVADLDSVSAFSASAKKLANEIDVLVCNAGALFHGLGKTREGIEMTFATCALGHHLMIELLKPKRVVWVTGDIYVLSKGRPSPYANYGGHKAYSDACLARLLLAREWRERGVNVVCVHPGVINTEFAKMGGVIKWIAGKILITPEVGGQAAVVATCEGKQGILPYFHNKRGWVKLGENDLAMQQQVGKELFEQCDKICGIQRGA